MLYHLVFPTKYRRIVLDEKVDQRIRDICLGISKRYEIHFLEIGTDKDHAHFLIQSITTWNVERLVTTIKSITAKQVFLEMPGLKKELWGSSLWTSGYYAATIGKNGSETVIRRYVKEQGREEEYHKLYTDQLKLL